MFLDITLFNTPSLLHYSCRTIHNRVNDENLNASYTNYQSRLYALVWLLLARFLKLNFECFNFDKNVWVEQGTFSLLLIKGKNTHFISKGENLAKSLWHTRPPLTQLENRQLHF